MSKDNLVYTWMVSAVNHDENVNVITHMQGTESQIRKYLMGLIKSNVEESEEPIDTKTERASELTTENKNVLEGYIGFVYHRSMVFTAQKVTPECARTFSPVRTWMLSVVDHYEPTNTLEWVDGTEKEIRKYMIDLIRKNAKAYKDCGCRISWRTMNMSELSTKPEEATQDCLEGSIELEDAPGMTFTAQVCNLKSYVSLD